MSKVVFYHASCADGFGAAYAIWNCYPDAQFIPCRYEDGYEKARSQAPSDLRDAEVFVVDFSFPRADMEKLFNEAGRVVWLDHHKTAFEIFDHDPKQLYIAAADPDWPWDNHDVVLDSSRSGALITWNYIWPGEEVPELLKRIDDYDRWQFKFADTKAVNKALWAHQPWDFRQWDHFAYATGALASQGVTLLNVHNGNVESTVKSCKMNCWISTPPLPEYAPMPGHDGTSDMFMMLGLAANCPPNLASDVGHKLATESGTYGLCWSLGSDFRVKCSLRSNGEYDVSAIAKAFGGGGHRNAAGFTTSLEILTDWIRP
jgi:uncharacterized protein